LYTDDEEKLFESTRQVIINGIEDLASKGDLLDRGIFVYLPPMPKEKRRPERELWAKFDDAHPRILGALLATEGRGINTCRGPPRAIPARRGSV
jgi:hypothetical protein